MRKRITAVVGTILIAAALLTGVMRGIGSGVSAKENENFIIDGTTLTAYIGSDTFVSIPGTVAVIGESAFAENTTLAKVQIPESVTEISYNAFGDCTALSSVIISDNVTKVGPGAFKGCTALTVAEIGEAVRSWGSGVFNDCSKLDKLIVDKDNPYLTYYNGALYNGNMTLLYQVLPGRQGENYVMPQEVRNIDTYAFWNLQKVKNVMVSNDVTTIPAYAMSNMGAVENVVLPTSVKTISEKAFANNEALKQVEIPVSVTNIHSTAFDNCPNLKIMTSASSTADTYGKEKKITVIYQAELPVEFTDSNIAAEKPSVGDASSVTAKPEEAPSDNQHTTADSNTGNAGKNNTSTSAATVPAESPLDQEEPESVVGKTIIVNGQAVILMDNRKPKVIGVPEMVEAALLAEEEEPEEESAAQNTKESIRVETKLTPEQDTQTKSESGAITEAEKKASSTINKLLGITNDYEENQIIGEREYYKQNKLTNYQINEKIKYIGRLAFARSGLSSIKIPKGVVTIDYGAFYACKALSDVSIPDTVTSIGNKAFADTLWLDNWYQNKAAADFLIVGDGILIAYKGNESNVEIPENVKQINPEVFMNHTEIESVNLPASVIKIGSSAFKGCSALKGLSGCEGLKAVVKGAFEGTQISEEDFL